MVCSPIEVMEDFSKELCPKNYSPSKSSPINGSWLFEETEGEMVGNFQETTNVHDENHTSVPEVKHSFNLVPLMFATNDVDIFFLILKLVIMC